jgi:hypothetical protein
MEMKIKLLKPYQLLEIGEVIDCIDSIAVELIKRKTAEIVLTQKTEKIKRHKK